MLGEAMQQTHSAYIRISTRSSVIKQTLIP